MSGGSFDYIYSKESDELLANESMRDQLDAIKDKILEKVNSGVYPKRIGMVLGNISIIQTKLRIAQSIKDEIDRYMGEISGVLRAVEWHCSNDTGPDDIETALTEMYKKLED